MREVNAAIDEMRKDHEPLASHIFVSRRAYQEKSDTKSGNDTTWRLGSVDSRRLERSALKQSAGPAPNRVDPTACFHLPDTFRAFQMARQSLQLAGKKSGTGVLGDKHALGCPDSVDLGQVLAVNARCVRSASN